MDHSLSKRPRLDTKSSQLEESTLIWKQGDTISSIGSVLVILAQNGYTNEAHTIIGLSRTASLIGRDSNGGLPELWDVMGKIRNKRGITRLMAICITRGPDSPQRALSLIRDHKVDIRARDDYKRTALHHAVGAFFENDPWTDMTNPLNLELIKVLIQAEPYIPMQEDISSRIALHYALGASNYLFGNYTINSEIVRYLVKSYPSGVKIQDMNLNFKYTYTSHSQFVIPIDYALHHGASSDIIKLLFEIYPEGIKYAKLQLSPQQFVNLLQEKIVKENGEFAMIVATQINNVCEMWRECRLEFINEGAPLALTELFYEKVVQENDKVKRSITEAYEVITGNELW
jgi:hypothetical protein